MTRKAAQTGPGAMVLVAIEQYYPVGERILTDDLGAADRAFEGLGDQEIRAEGARSVGRHHGPKALHR